MSKKHLTTQEFNEFVSRYSLADRMQERCFRLAMKAFDIEDQAEFEQLRDHWLTRRNYWHQRKAAMRIQAENLTIAEEI